jgi:hypothetical protein
MGCCACINKKGNSYGTFDNSIILKIKKDNPNIIKNRNSSSSGIESYYELNKKLISLNRNSTDRDLLTINQQRADSILEYINQIKLKPQDFFKEAKEHDLYDMLNEYNESKKKVLFVKNRFYNSLLESYVKRTPNLDEEIEKGIYNEINLSKYDKQFYIVNSTIMDPNESIWILLKQNKEKALNSILITRVSYLVLCVSPIQNTPNIKVYFLFLQMKNH